MFDILCRTTELVESWKYWKYGEIIFSNRVHDRRRSKSWPEQIIGNPIGRRTVLGIVGIANTAVLRKLRAGWSITTPSGEAGRGRGAAITRSRHRLSLLDLSATGGPGQCPSAPTRPRLPSSRDRQTDRQEGPSLSCLRTSTSDSIYPPSASEGERIYLPLREWSTEQTFLVWIMEQ